MNKGDTLITEKNGFYLWVCTNRMFDYCLTIKPYIALHSIVLCSNDFYSLWDRTETSSHAQTERRVHKKREQLQLRRSLGRDDLTSTLSTFS